MDILPIQEQLQYYWSLYAKDTGTSSGYFATQSLRLTVSRVCLTFCFGSSQCGNMAREGLRTLVVAKKVLTEEQYQDFEVCTYICLYATNYPERCFLVCLRFVFYFLEVFLMVSKLQRYSLKL